MKAPSVFVALILLLGVHSSRCAASYTNTALAFSITNWSGASDPNRVFLTIHGDSIPASYTEGGSVEFLTTDVASSLFENGFRRTNGAVISSVMAEIYQRATNIVVTRQPRFLLFQSPHNTLVDAFDVPGQSWSAWLATNNALLATCKSNGTTLLYGEILPFTSDWNTVFTNWNAALNQWAATNYPYVRVVPFFNFFKSPTNDMVIRVEWSFDLRHLTRLGQTNFALFLLTNMSLACTVTSASPSRVDVGSAYTNSQPGDTLFIPSGTAHWTNGLVVTKAITIQGAGTNDTVLLDSIPFGDAQPCMFKVTLSANKNNRITALQFALGTNRTGTAQILTSGVIEVNGSNADSRRMRLDHLYINYVNAEFFNWNGAQGVVDHNYAIATNQVFVGYIRMANWNGGSYGDGSIATNDLFGTDNALFIEDNIFTNALPANHVTAIDGDAGSRVVVRYNTFGKGSIDCHGAEASRLRGGRAYEIYGNNFVGNDSGSGVLLIRSGTWIVLSNTVTGYQQGDFPFNIEDSRVENAVNPWGAGNAERAGADGLNPWHANASTTPFTNGTVSAGHTEISASLCSVPVSGSPWTVNQWLGYSIVKTSGKTVSSITRSGTTITVNCTSHGFSTGNRITIKGADQAVYNEQGASITVVNANSFTFELGFGGGTPTTPATGTMYCFQGYGFSDILSNTVNTIYYRHSSQGAGGPAYFLRFTNSPADTFEVYKVVQVFDGTGRAGGTLISGDPPTRPASNDQTTSMCYAWGNTREGGTAIGFQSVHLNHARGGEHWTNGVVKVGYATFTYPNPLTSGEASSGAVGAISQTIGVSEAKSLPRRPK